MLKSRRTLLHRGLLNYYYKILVTIKPITQPRTIVITLKRLFSHTHKTKLNMHIIRAVRESLSSVWT